MAAINIYQPGQPANPGAAPARAKRQYLPEATAAANAVAVILVERYGQAQWILQCMNAIREAVQNSIEMLSGQAPQANALALGQGGQYAFKARTAQELQQTQDQAAVNGVVTPATAQQQRFAEDPRIAQQAEQAMAAGNVDMFQVLQRAAGMQDPATGQVPPQQPQQTEAPNEPGSDEWIL